MKCNECWLFMRCPGPDSKRCPNKHSALIVFFEDGKFNLSATLRNVSKHCSGAIKTSDLIELALFCANDCKRKCLTGKYIRQASQNLLARERQIKIKKALGSELKLKLFNRACVVLGTLPTRAAKRGVKFDLDEDWLIERMRDGRCEATGIKFQDKKPFRPSFDRINNKLGYTKDNTWLVLWMYNRAKGEDTVKDLQEMAKAICENNNQCVQAFMERTGVERVR